MTLVVTPTFPEVSIWYQCDLCDMARLRCFFAAHPPPAADARPASGSRRFPGWKPNILTRSCGISYFLSRIELTHVLQPRVHPLHSTPIVSIVSCLSYLSSILASRVRSRSVRVCTVQTRILSLPCALSRPLDSPRALRRLATAVFLTRLSGRNEETYSGGRELISS